MCTSAVKLKALMLIVLFIDDLASKANIIIDPAEISAISMDDLDEDDENITQQVQKV